MPPKSKECPPGKILNPETNRCVKYDSKVGKTVLSNLSKAEADAIVKAAKKALANAERASVSPKPNAPKSKSPSPDGSRLERLVLEQAEAMKSRNIPLWKKLTLEIEEEKRRLKRATEKSIPAFLEACRSPVDKTLPKLPTIDGERDLADVIKEEKQLILIDNMCYDIKSLYELINSDIAQGNVWGVNPYVKAEGFVLPFEKGVKERVLREGVARGVLPKSASYIDHSPKSATDKELRGTMTIQLKKTPSAWLRKGWASDGSAFPTPRYHAVTFDFPNKKTKQNPGRTAIFPDSAEAKAFINDKLKPAYDAGCIWSKKISVTDGIEVINPNIHMVFEDNQPERWYAQKLENLNQEILKFAPAFS